MTAFCTGCGASLNPGTAFCTGCGAAANPATEPARRSRKWPWVLAVILLFALGFWLGRMMAPKCQQCPAAPMTGTGGAGGGGGGAGGNPKQGAGGEGDHDKGGAGDVSGSGRVLGDGGPADGGGGGGSVGSGKGTGDMAGGGKSSVNGVTVGGGNGGSAAGASGSDDDGGGVGGKGNPGQNPNGPDSDPDVKKRTEMGVWRLAAGAPLTTGNGDVPQSDGKDSGVKVLSARDFSYDKTGLPRYLDANKAVFSAMSYDVQGRTDAYGSASGIVTGSAFDDVVDWYRKNLPPGWSDTTIGDLNRFGAAAQALSPDKILQMIAGTNNAPPAKSADDIPVTDAAHRQRISMFSPPTGTNRYLGVMIVQNGVEPVTIMMKTHIAP